MQPQPGREEESLLVAEGHQDLLAVIQSVPVSRCKGVVLARGENLLHRLADQFRRFVAEHGIGMAIGPDDPAGVIDLYQRGRNGGAQRVLAIALDQEFFHSGCPLRVSGLSLWL